MTRSSRAVASIALACLGASLLLAWPGGRAHADPTIDVPPAHRGVILRDHDRAVRLALLADIDITAVIATGDMSDYPDLGTIEPASGRLASARVGLLGASGAVRYVLRLDLSESLRVRASDFDDRPGAAVDRFIDDAAVWWSPRVWARFAVGRHKVPFSRFRQLERVNLTTGAVPFVVERVAPDRRWGATTLGDLGALAYAAGVYADLDALESRRPEDPSANPALPPDPSEHGRMLATAYVWWTPRAPLSADHMPSPPGDPWFRTLRPAAGLGVLWRERQGADRLDVSLAVQLAYWRVAAITEILAFSDQGTLGLGASLQASVLVSDEAVLFALGDYDSQESTWSAGGGAAFFVTRDRTNKLGLVGWMRRDTRGGPNRDGVLIELRATL